MGDVLIAPASAADAMQSSYRRQRIGQTAVLTCENRSPPKRIFLGNSLVVSVGIPQGDVSALGRALISGDMDAAKAAALALDGHFAVFAISPDGVMAVTDAAGSIPIYHHTSNGVTVLGTRVDDVADAVGAKPDTLSVYDFAIHRVICHPYTWYSDVFVCQPASIIAAGAALEQIFYWLPAEAPRMTPDEAAPALRARLQEAAHVAAQEKLGLLMSAGEDSRAVASFLPPQNVTGYVFVNAKNREWAFADLAAKVLGFPLVPLIRDDGDAAAKIEERQRFIGSGYDITQGHVFPFADDIPEQRLAGGWASDTLFKGYFLRPRNGRFRPPRGPKGRFDGPRGEDLRERYNNRYAELESLVPAPSYEWLRVWPLSAHPHFSHYASARRYFEHHEPYFYAKTFRLSASLTAEDKFSRMVFYNATNPQLGLAGWLPTGRGTIPALNGAEAELAMQMIRWHDKYVTPGVSQSPWGRTVPIRESPSYPETAGDIDDALAEFDGGRLMAWVKERAASLEPGQSDWLLPDNRLIQVGMALRTGHRRRQRGHASMMIHPLAIASTADLLAS